ncbi:hypothetical protein HDV05_003673 [Chytridiales sp. JEL 0842]|nr:hypothetical protein HDV05_003673 [Chytridiales sp. JEL 0842]
MSSKDWFLMVRHGTFNSNGITREILRRVDRDHRDPESGDTLLHAAVRADDVDLIELLLNKNTHYLWTYAKNRDELTPLGLAVKLARFDYFATLLIRIRYLEYPEPALIKSI